MENKKFDFKIDGSELVLSIDPNQDGQKVLSLKISLTEALGEAMMRGDAVPGVKMADVSFSGTMLKIVVDTDKDGENLLEMELDMAEAFDEIMSAFKKDKPASE